MHNPAESPGSARTLVASVICRLIRLARAETVARRSRATVSAHPALGFCRGTPLKAEIEQRDPALLGAAVEHAAAAVAARFGPTDIEGKIQAHILDCVR